LCGGQGAVDMAVFAEAKEPFLRGFLKLGNLCTSSLLASCLHKIEV